MSERPLSADSVEGLRQFALRFETISSDSVLELIATVHAAWADRDKALEDARTVYDDLCRIDVEQDAQIDTLRECLANAHVEVERLRAALANRDLRDSKLGLTSLAICQEQVRLEKENEALRAETVTLTAILEQQRLEANP